MLIVDAGKSEERKGLFRGALKGDQLEVRFIDEASPAELEKAEILLQSFSAGASIAKNVSLLKNLRMLQTISAGVDLVPFDSIPPNVTICSNAGAFSEPIAEHTLGLILSLGKRLKENEMKMRSGVFDQETRTLRFSGRTLGVIGYGGIGKAVASLCRCMGMKVYAISRNPEDAKSCDMHGGMDKLDDMLSKSDVVVISIPLNRTTRGLIDRKKLSLMKEDAILVNVARGDIVVEKDLFDHLRAHPRFCAGIEAWWKEPRREERFSGNLDFLALPNAIGSPHNSGIVDGMPPYIVSRALDNILRFATGKEPLNVVKREDYI